MTSTERLEALREFSAQQAQKRGTDAPSVSIGSPNDLMTGLRVNGRYDPVEHRIELNPDLLGQQTPYPAVETLLHEDRHVQQRYLIANPERADRGTPIEDFERNYEAYFPPTEDYALYRSQPIEVDARRHATAQLNELYKDDREYQQYAETRGIEEHLVDFHTMLSLQRERENSQDPEHIAREMVYRVSDIHRQQRTAETVTQTLQTAASEERHQEHEQHSDEDETQQYSRSLRR